jgi:hypothetical protein
MPLQKTHRVLLPGDGATPEFCRKLNALAVSASEFVAAGRDYPIVFASGDAGKSFAPVIILGFEHGINLFVDAAGEWDRSCYFPAYVRRFPFCLSQERVVCVVKSYVDKGGVALHDKAGKATPQWQPIEALLAGFQVDLERTAQFCTALLRLELLERFSAEMKEPQVKVAGMARVSEQKLRALAPAQLKALAEKGYLGLIYAHLHSLQGFGRLAERLKSRKAAGKGSPASRRSRPK